MNPRRDDEGSFGRSDDSEIFSFAAGDGSSFSWDDGHPPSPATSDAETRPVMAAGSLDAMAWNEGDDPLFPDFAASQPVALPPGRPPVALLAAGAALSVVGVVLAVLLQESWVGLGVGWLLAGPLAILTLGQYVEKDGLQRSRPMYTGGSATRHYPTLLGILALLSVVVVAVLAAGKAAKAW